MAAYGFHFLRASLSIFDTPVGYSPPRGPDVRFEVTYNQREAYQPATFFFSNFGKRWTHDWMSYIEDDPMALGNPLELYPRGGGRESYEGFVGGVSKPQQDNRAVMTIVSTNPIKYERELPDGSKEVFAQSDGAGSAPRRIFLTEIHDPQGNKLTLTGSFVIGSGIADLIAQNGGARFPTLPNPALMNPAPEYIANIDDGLVTFDRYGVL